MPTITLTDSEASAVLVSLELRADRVYAQGLRALKDGDAETAANYTKVSLELARIHDGIKSQRDEQS